MKQTTPKPRWTERSLWLLALCWLGTQRRRNRGLGEKSPWWIFVARFPAFVKAAIPQFVRGHYRFSPRQHYFAHGEQVRVWTYPDKLMLWLLLALIKPVVRHLISPFCFHLKGPSGVKSALRCVQNALATGEFTHVFRLDSKSYYASISQPVLLKQLQQHFQDKRLLGYLEQILTIAVDAGGDVFVPRYGIPIRSSLSPFLGAVYLGPLDAAFTKRPGFFYARYMDDIIILVKTPSCYRKTKRQLFQILKSLKLTLSPTKSWMGKLEQGFHFLGMHFEPPQSAQGKTKPSVRIHSRSCARALAKVKTLSHDAVHPALIQRYLARWATWWSQAVNQVTFVACLNAWVEQSNEKRSSFGTLGRGLIYRYLPSQRLLTADLLW